MSLKTVFASFFLIVGLSSCIDDQISATPTASSWVFLTPYISPSPSQAPIINTPVVVTPTDLPTPTPTPVKYTVVQGDTMLAIAFRNGISLEELLAANPEVNPRLLSIGTELIIPLSENVPNNPMTATPLPIETGRPDCYPVADGIWCFLLVTNDRDRQLENISAQIVLYDEAGEMLTKEVAISPINKISVDEEIPLVIFFPGSFPREFQAISNVISAQPVPKGDLRYLDAWLEVDGVEISADGMHAEVNGSIGIPKNSVPGNVVWIVATAYDKEGSVVGVRKLERFGLLEPGTSQDFDIEVFSLGPEIIEVKAVVEARP